MKFRAEITGQGTLALEFLKDEEANFLILFNENAPPELAEISILHKPSEIFEIPQRGDMLLIGEKAFEVTAVGDEAVNTLQSLGHCTISFKGGNIAERPGMIMVQGEEKLLPADLCVGAAIEIH